MWAFGWSSPWLRNQVSIDFTRLESVNSSEGLSPLGDWMNFWQRSWRIWWKHTSAFHNVAAIRGFLIPRPFVKSDLLSVFWQTKDSLEETDPLDLPVQRFKKRQTVLPMVGHTRCWLRKPRFCSQVRVDKAHKIKRYLKPPDDCFVLEPWEGITLRQKFITSTINSAP